MTPETSESMAEHRRAVLHLPDGTDALEAGREAAQRLHDREDYLKEHVRKFNELVDRADIRLEDLEVEPRLEETSSRDTQPEWMRIFTARIAELEKIAGRNDRCAAEMRRFWECLSADRHYPAAAKIMTFIQILEGKT